MLGGSVSTIVKTGIEIGKVYFFPQPCLTPQSFYSEIFCACISICGLKKKNPTGSNCRLYCLPI